MTSPLPRRAATPEPADTEVAFQVERFAWRDDGALEVAGRWHGLEGRRLRRARLTVHASGRRRAVTAEQHGERATGDELWRAVFPWGDDAPLPTAAELDVGRNLVVELPAPDVLVRRARFAPEAPAAPPAPDPRIAPLADALSAMRTELSDSQSRAQDAVDRVEQERAAAKQARQEAEEHRAEMERLGEELAAVQAELEQERARTSAVRDELAALRETVTRDEGEVTRLREQLAAVRAELQRDLRAPVRAPAAAARPAARPAAGARPAAVAPVRAPAPDRTSGHEWLIRAVVAGLLLLTILLLALTLGLLD